MADLNTTTSKDRLRLALSIITGRTDLEMLTTDELELLGYDTYKFGYFGKPTENETKQKAEEIVFNAITATWSSDDEHL